MLGVDALKSRYLFHRALITNGFTVGQAVIATTVLFGPEHGDDVTTAPGGWESVSPDPDAAPTPTPTTSRSWPRTSSRLPKTSRIISPGVPGSTCPPGPTITPRSPKPTPAPRGWRCSRGNLPHPSRAGVHRHANRRHGPRGLDGLAGLQHPPFNPRPGRVPRAFLLSDSHQGDFPCRPSLTASKLPGTTTTS